MPIANPTTHPDAQPDVPRTAAAPVSAVDEAANRGADGPIQGTLARSVDALRNAASAIGPVNFLPLDWPADDIQALDAATAVLQRLLDARAVER